MLSKQDLLHIRDQFQKGLTEYYWEGIFPLSLTFPPIEMKGTFSLEDYPEKESEKILRFSAIKTNCVFTGYELGDLSELIYRAEWSRKLMFSKQIEAVNGFNSISLDIKYFHIIFRSILDYLAKIIRYLGKDPAQITDKGFDKLFIWAETKPKKSIKILGSQKLHEIILSARWYKLIRKVRNIIVHQGGRDYISFGNQKEILFTIFKKKKDKDPWFDAEGTHSKVNPILLAKSDPNWIDFELYTAYYHTHLLKFLNDVGPLVNEHLGLPKEINRYPMRHLSLMFRWMEKLEEQLTV